MRRLLLVGTFVTALLAVLVGGHVYLAARLVLEPRLPDAVTNLGLIVLAALGAMLPLQPLAERLLPTRLARSVSWTASLWMGAAFFLLVTLAASDVLAVLLGAFVPSGAATAARARAAVAIVLALAGSVAGVRSVLRGPALRRLEVHVPRWPAGLDGFRLVQVSDLHLGPILDRRFMRHVVERVAELDPDLVAITGDLVDGSIHRLAPEAAPLAELGARHGVFFVTGNHDYYSGADAWVAEVRRLGVRVLRNERVTIGEGDQVFDLAGVEDHHAHLVSAAHREDLPRALAGRDPARAVVLLAHDPATFPAAARLGVDLQLSGHTHGGQLWPFRYFVRLATPYVAGLHRRGASQLYVSRGTGFWGPAMRLFAPAEITEIVLHRRA
jgi:predicted MPP superfamily phosphohydrolase